MIKAKIRLLAALIFIAVLASPLCAQSLPEYKYIPREKDWFSYDLSTLFLIDVPDAYVQEGWSNGHTISFMKDNLIGKSKWSFAIGLAYTSNNFKSNIRHTVDEASGDGSYEVLNPDSTAYHRNKLNVKYVELPIELRYRSQPDKNGMYLKMYFGIKGGVRFSSYSLFENSQSQVRYYHPKELNRWSASTYLRVGYGSVSIYALYSLLPLFNYTPAENLPPQQVNMNEMIPLGIGLSVSI